MKYIASCSFGKDSLAMILTIIEHGLPLDEVVYREVMFDDTTSGEYPEHADFIHNKAVPILELVYGLKVTVLRAKTNYKERLARPNTKGKHIGEPRGFPLRLGPWCNSELKMKPLRDYERGLSEAVHEYVGIAVDEPARLERVLKTDNASAPLADFGITEEMAFKMCQEHYLLSPIYKTQKRSGCWFCHNARLDEMRDLWRNYPELWEELRKLQAISPIKFTSRNSVFDLEERFKKEDADHEKTQEIPAPGQAPDV